jgi:hypothetical protein
MNLIDSNSVLAEICISYLQSDFAKENSSMLEYSAIYWTDHYRQSERNYQAELAVMTQDLCQLPDRRTKWTKIHSEHITIPVSGPPLCLASALGLERAVKLYLSEQHSIGVGPEAEVDSKDSKFGRTPLLWAARNGHEPWPSYYSRGARPTSTRRSALVFCTCSMPSSRFS